jgi:hypothetical protein
MPGPTTAPASAFGANEWIGEGLRQVRLFGLWSALCRAAGEGGLAHEIRHAVLAPFAAPAWWPDVPLDPSGPRPLMALVEELFQKTTDPRKIAAFGGHFVTAFRREWLAAREGWAPGRPAEQIEEVRRCSARAFQAAVALARSATEPADDPDEPTELTHPAVEWLSPARMTGHWLAQARALAAWRRIARRFQSLPVDGRAARTELAGRCERLAGAIQQRNGPTGLAALFRRPPPGDRKLFEEAHGLLLACAQALRQPPTAATVPEGFLELQQAVEQHLRAAPSWPPNWLAQLPETLGDDGLLARIEPAPDDPTAALPEAGLAPGAVARLLLLGQLAAALDRAGRLTDADVYRLAPFREEFAAWLESPEGLDWFDRLAKQAQDGTGAARDWLGALERAGWCRCWPHLDLNSGAAAWPDDGFVQLANVPGVFHDLDRRRVVEPVRRFAPRPELADCTVSLGPRRSDSASALADAVVKAAGELAQRPEVAGPLGCLAVASHDAEAHRRPVPEPEALAADALDALAHEALRTDAPAGTADRLDAALGALIRWCAKFGLTVLPRGWRFAGGAAPADGEADPVFNPAPAGAAVGLYQFGLEQQGRPLRPARLAVSAGPAPPGYQAMCDAVSGDSPVERELRRRLADWPRQRAASESGLEFEAVTFFQDYWDRHHAELERLDPGRAGQFARALEELLLAAFALRRFEPAELQDANYRPTEHWMEVRCPHGQPRTGRVVRLIRPGLLKDDVAAPTRAVKAVVEVE